MSSGQTDTQTEAIADKVDATPIKLALGVCRIEKIEGSTVEILVCSPGGMEVHRFEIGDEFELAIFALETGVVKR